MSATIDDGGPIHPGQWYDFQPTSGVQVVTEQWQGMSLRDYFAGQALEKASRGGSKSAEAIAARAYCIADAMLSERKAAK